MSQSENLIDMVAIPIREFVSGSTVPVDLFVRLSNDKYVLVAKEDSKTQPQQMQQYEQKKVEFLYVRRQDYNRYVSNNVIIAGMVLSHKEIAASRKADFLSKSAMSVMKEIEELGMSPEAFEHAKLVATATTSLVESKTDLFNMLETLGKMCDEKLAHSVAVSALSVMIGKAMGWTKKGTFEKVAIGGLLHDVGMKEIPAAILNKPRTEMTVDEMAIYESHAFRGMEILHTVPAVPDDVISIVYEHHENAIGEGYPRKIRDIKQNPLAKVVAVADIFSELTIRNVNNSQVLSALDALKHIEVTMAQPYNKEVFQALKAVIKNQTMSKAS